MLELTPRTIASRLRDIFFTKFFHLFFAERLVAWHSGKPVRRRATDCRSRPGRVVRRRAINALECFSGGTDMFLPPAPNTCRSTTARPRRHSKTSYSTCPVRLDYCNAVLAGLPASTLTPFQRVLHAAARTVQDLKPRDRVTPAPGELHWLPVDERIQYKLCLLVHKSLL